MNHCYIKPQSLAVSFTGYEQWVWMLLIYFWMNMNKQKDYGTIIAYFIVSFLKVWMQRTVIYDKFNPTLHIIDIFFCTIKQASLLQLNTAFKDRGDLRLKELSWNCLDKEIGHTRHI